MALSDNYRYCSAGIEYTTCWLVTLTFDLCCMARIWVAEKRKLWIKWFWQTEDYLPFGVSCNNVQRRQYSGCTDGSRHGRTGRGRPQLTKSKGWSWLREAVCLGHGGELSWKQYVMLLSITNVHILVEIISFKSLTFGSSFVWKWTKGFHLSSTKDSTLGPRRPGAPRSPLSGPFGKSWIRHWVDVFLQCWPAVCTARGQCNHMNLPTLDNISAAFVAPPRSRLCAVHPQQIYPIYLARAELWLQSRSTYYTSPCSLVYHRHHRGSK